MEKKQMTNIAPLSKKNFPAPNIGRMSEVRSFTRAEMESLKIVNSHDEGSAHLKVFRDLRTRLIKHAKGENFICLVTSAAPGGGSHVAVNLAATIALDKSKTSVLVDCNIYSPYAEQLLPVPSHFGLTDYLDDPNVGAEEVVYASGIPRLRVVPVGYNREGGTEKLNSNRMKEFFYELKSRYPDRFIVVDAPAASDYDAEIRILADLCDCVVLVVPYGKVTEVQLYSAIDKIGRERLAGVVYNQC